MPVCGYLVTPKAGTCDGVMEQLQGLAGCRVSRADQCDLLVLVTETGTDDDERDLQSALNRIEDIQCLALTFGQIQPPVGAKETP